MNIPKNYLDNSKNIMVIGLGGGLPFIYHWNDKNFILVNSGSANDFYYKVSTEPPEGKIPERHNIEVIYTVGRHGSGIVTKAYKEIANKHQIDCILAIDGVDSLAKGNEENYGTILEDFIALSAISCMKYNRVLCTAGFGTETEEELNHYRILENIATIISQNGFLGSFSLTQNMPEFQEYVKTCEIAWENYRKSHIQTKIISATKGRFNRDNIYQDIDPKLAKPKEKCFISPLSSIYWLFDFEKVINNNKAIETIKKSNTFADAQILLKEFLNLQKFRSYEILPL